MNVQHRTTVQHGVEILVPLNKLKKSPRNARKTPHTEADIEALAASIAVKGVLQPPVVEPERDGNGEATGAYLATIGEGRRLALRLLAKRKLIAKTEPIRCLVDEANDAFEVSLDENVTRFRMHPADEFEAFRDLAEQKGWGAEEIATRFGCSAQVVKQRLRLGAVSPVLMAHFRAGDLTLDQMMAFALTDDHARQEQVYASLSYNRSASLIRRLLTEQEVEASDRRAVFVGVEAYEAAGGRVRRDLFAEDRGGWFEDVGLLDRLVTEKLAAEAEAVRTAEGWRWAEAHIDYPHAHGLRRVYPRAPEVDEANQARLSALAEEYDALIAEHGDNDPLPEEVEQRLAVIDAELQAASQAVYDPEDIGRAGVFVVLDWEGVARVERGFVRAEDEPPAPEVASDQDSEDRDGEGGPAQPKALEPLPERLVTDLTAHRTATRRDRLAEQPEAALLALLHGLVLQAFYPGSDDSCLELRSVRTDLSIFADGYRESVAGQKIEARHAAWAERLPRESRLVWAMLVELAAEDRQALLAHCVSLTVNAVRGLGRSSRALAHADAVADHLGLDMTAYWQATTGSYFGRVSKAHILAAVAEAKPEAVGRLEGLKKDAMADAAADLLGADQWLPPLLRPAAAGPA